MNREILNQVYKIRDIVLFAKTILGMSLNPGQEYWMKNAWKLVNILKPANQWGKTTALAIIHIYQAMCKPQLDPFKVDFDTWLKTRYQTLNFGKTYEVAKGVMEAVIDISEGNYLLPNGEFNKSLIAGWGIKNIQDTPKLPKIVWWNNSDTLIRSYDGLGESFKRLKLAYVSGDETGDIPELNLFLNGTLIPRTFFYRASIHLVGTAQPQGLEYEELEELALEDIREKKENSDYFVLSAKNNPERASVFQNIYMPQDYLRKIESTVDPTLRKQIMYGFYVDYSDHLYTWEEVNQMFTDSIPYEEESGMSEEPKEGAYYVFAVDMAAADDETSVTGIRYNRKEVFYAPAGETLEKPIPHKIVFHKAWKGKSIPLYLQYELIKQYFKKYKEISPHRTKFVYDAGSLGGKNAEQAFKDLGTIYPFPPTGRSYAEIKAEMFGIVKEVLGRDRSFIINQSSKKVDKNPNWGGLKGSNKLKELRRQFEVASKDDDKLKNDQFASVSMALHFIERRVPKVIHNKAVDFNFNRSLNSPRVFMT